MSIVGKTSQSFSGFSPTSIPDCVLWLDALDSNSFTYSSGSNIATWRDKSGFSNNSTGVINTPTLRQNSINGYPAVFISSNAIRGAFSNTISNNKIHCFMVCTPLSTNGSYPRFLGLDDGVNAEYNSYQGIQAIGRQAGANFVVSRQNSPVTVNITDNIPHIVTSYNDISGHYITVNGSATFAGGNSGTTSNFAISKWNVGCETSGSLQWNPQVYIGEILVYSNALSSNARYQVEGYLTAKWGLTVPSTHPFKRAPIGASPFAPTSIPGCVLWLDASDSSTLTLSGSNVTAWRDKSASSNTVTVVSSGTRPNWNSTRRSVIVGSNGYFTVPLLTVAKEYGFFVYQAYSTAASDFFVGNNNYTRRIRLGGTNADFSTYSIAWIVGPDCNIGGGTSNTNLFRFDTTSRLVRNGGTTSFSGTALSNVTIQTGTLTRLGEFAGQLGGEIMEAVVFQGVDLTARQIDTIESYLAQKWGLASSVASTSLYDPIRPFTRPFIPVDISGCALWLDGLDPSGTGVRPANGTTISTWVDKSGGGQNATAGGTTPIYSNSMVNFNGNGYLSNTAFTYALQNRSVFIVASQTSSSSASAFEGIFVLGATGGNYDYANNNSCIYLGRGSNGGQNDAFGVYLAGDYIVSYLTNAVPAPFAVYSDVFGSNSGTLYANGNTAQSDTTTGTIGSGTGYLVGARYYTSPAAYLYGGVSELIMYRTALTAGQRQQVETYLTNKWGLRGSTPSNHAARLAPALTTQFNPLLIAGCRLWLDSADTTTVSVSGSNVTQWTDRSGNGFNFTVRSGDSNPVYTSNAVNGLNALSFTGSGGENARDMMLRNTSISVNVSAYSMFVVARQNASSPSPYGANYILGTVSGSPLLYGTYTGGNFITSVGSTGSFNDLTVNSPNTQMKSTSVTGMVVNGSVLTPYFNGTAMSTKNGATGSYTGIDIGASGGGQTWQGFICEILIFNSAITTTERQFVEGYLANKWGTASSLPAGHPFKTAKP